MLCEAPIREVCFAGVHTMIWKCYEERPTKCKQCEKETKRIKKQAKLDLDAKELKQEATEHEHELLDCKLEAVLEHATEVLSDLNGEESESEINQKDDAGVMEQPVKQVASMAATHSDETSSSLTAAGSPSTLSSPPPFPSQDQLSTQNNTAQNQVRFFSRNKWGFQTQSNLRFVTVIGLMEGSHIRFTFTISPIST